MKSERKKKEKTRRGKKEKKNSTPGFSYVAVRKYI